MQKIGIVIVNWNTGLLLSKCIKSIQDFCNNGELEQVVVVDNSSQDESVSQAKAVINGQIHIQFIESNKNIGFAAANNLALRQLNRINARCHVLLLNPDTEVGPGSLLAMKNVLEQNERAGIVGPLLIGKDGKRQDSVRRFPTLATFVWLFLKLNRLWPNVAHWRKYLALDFTYQADKSVDQVMGAAFMIKRAALEEVGLLDEKFFVWFEEVDWCRRAKNMNWSVMFTPRAQIKHVGAVSFNQLYGWKKNWLWLKSSLHYARKHLGLASYWLLVGLIPVAMLASVPGTIINYWRRKVSG